MTPDLFDRQPMAQRFTRAGNSIVPPQPEELACRRRERGIARAADSAGREWQDKAVGYVRLHATVHAFLMAEEVRQMAEADGFAPPPTKKAWGPVMQRAARAGLVKANGYAPAKSSNLSPKVLWMSLVAA